MVDYPKGVTQADHIAHDIRVGRFPKQSTIEEFLAERAAAAAEGGESLREALRKAVYSFAPCEDQETDLDGRPAGKPYTVPWEDARDAYPASVEAVDEALASVWPLISAHVAARVADAEARAFERAIAAAEWYTPLPLNPTAEDCDRSFRFDSGVSQIVKRIRALAQQPAPVAEADVIDSLGCVFADLGVTPPTPVEAAPDAATDARREQIAEHLWEEWRGFERDEHDGADYNGPWKWPDIDDGRADFYYRRFFVRLAESTLAILAALPARDAAPAQGEPYRWLRRSPGGHETLAQHPAPFGLLAAGVTETPLYRHPAPARTEPSEVEAAVEAEHEACIADCYAEIQRRSSARQYDERAAIDACIHRIRTRGAGGGA